MAGGDRPPARPSPAPRDLRGHEGVRDHSSVPSAGPEAPGRPWGCSLLLLFPSIFVLIARIWDRGRPGRFPSFGLGPRGAPIPAPGGACRKIHMVLLIAGVGCYRLLNRLWSFPAGLMKQIFPEGNFYPLLSSTGPYQKRSDLDTFIYKVVRHPRRSPSSLRVGRRLSLPETA